MANATQIKFGYPGSLIAEYQHWCVLLRPAQATLGALVLVCTDDATAFGDISSGAFAELGQVTANAETALNSFQPYNRINYLMLMMVDPDVHFHVLPRYAMTQEFAGMKFPDPGWPGPPELGTAVNPDAGVSEDLRLTLRSVWPQSESGQS